MLPTIFHVGFGQSASSFLQRQFSEHPEINFTNPSGVVQKSILNNVRLGKTGEVEWLASNQCLKAAKVEIVSREAFVGFFPLSRRRRHVVAPYCLKDYQEAVANYLKDRCFRANILCVTRSPNDSVVSSYSQYIKFGGILPLENFYRSYQWYFNDLFDYDFLINLYRGLFGSESVLVVPYELLRDLPSRFMEVVSDHIGVDLSVAYRGERVNARLIAAQLSLIRKTSVLLDKLSSCCSEKDRELLFVLISKIAQDLPMGGGGLFLKPWLLALRKMLWDSERTSLGSLKFFGCSSSIVRCTMSTTPNRLISCTF